MSYRILDNEPRAVWQAVWEGDVPGAFVALEAIIASFPSLTYQATAPLYLLAKGDLSTRIALKLILQGNGDLQECPPEVVAGPDWAAITSWDREFTLSVNLQGKLVKIIGSWATPSPTHLAMIREAADAAGVRLDTCPLTEFSASLDEADGKRAIRKAQELAYNGQWEVSEGRVTARTYEPDKMYNTFYGLG